jgi:hypothetical protein
VHGVTLCCLNGFAVENGGALFENVAVKKEGSYDHRTATGVGVSLE